MGRVRIKDIARIANVSTGTVDRVIHGRAGVSEATKQHIEKILKDYDYQPDIIAGTLASGKNFKFLVCMPDIVNAHAFWEFPQTGVEKALDEIQYFDVQVEYVRFDQHDITDFKQKAAAIDFLAYDGLLFAPVFSDASVEFIDKWKEAGKPCILFNSRVEEDNYDLFIGQDAFQSGYLAGKLMNYGLPVGKDLLILNLSLRRDNYQHIIERERGFRSYFEEHSDRINNLVTLDINRGDYGQIAKELEEKMSNMNVVGLFVTNSRVHLVARFLAERGAMSIRLIGYDLIPESIDYLKREYIDFLISQSPEEQAYMGLKYLFNKVVLKKEFNGDLLMPIDVLTKENIDYYIKFNKQHE